jgi:hypothetical protein
MLIGLAVLFGMFLLSSVYLQDVLGTGHLETGLAFLPVALAAGLGAHGGGHLSARWARAISSCGVPRLRQCSERTKEAYK